MRNLQQKVVNLHSYRVFTVRVLKSKAQSLLGIESLVFNLPPVSTPFCKQWPIIRRDLHARNPSMGIFARQFLPAFQHIEGKLVPLRVVIRNAVDPKKALDQAFPANSSGVFLIQWEKVPEFLIDGGQIAIFQDDEILPPILSANLKDRTFGKAAIQEEQNRKVRKRLL